MTLVVARKLTDGPHLACDSQLTDSTGRRLNPYSEGALKLVIVHRGLCVGFDGGEMSGRSAVLRVAASLGSGFDLNEVRRVLMRASRDGTNGFIVAALAPAPTLIRIRGGVDEGERFGAWLGDRPAFAAFQAYLDEAGSLPHEIQHDLRRHLPPDQRDTAARLLPAMMQVIEDDRFGGVGGMPIYVAPSAVGFRYEAGAMLATDPDRPTPPGKEPAWGTVAEGRFGYVLKVPGVAGVGAIGAYFPHGRLGVLYYPARSETPICFTDIGDSEFTAAVEKRFGFPFGRRGLGFADSPSTSGLQVTP